VPTLMPLLWFYVWPMLEPNPVFASVDWVAHGIDIAQSYFSAWQFRTAETTADGGGFHVNLT